ncbi:MAG TPA: hypothetical protein VHT28_06590 [Silvibacterium sp.]|nr:hypothetical protein [Silvibacterium sp.]
MNPGINHAQQNYDQRIDRTLRQLGSVTPAAGIEDRIRARLAHEESKARARGANRGRFFAIPRFAIGVTAGALACVAIIAGSVNHSRRILPTVPGVVLPAGSSGVGAASAAHVANQPVSPPPQGRARSVRQTVGGRAVISPETQKPAGVTVPRTPSPAPGVVPRP